IKNRAFRTRTAPTRQNLAHLHNNWSWYEDFVGMAFEELRATLVMGIPLIRAGDKRTGIRDNHSAFRRAISSRISSERSARSGSAESVPIKDNRRRGLGEHRLACAVGGGYGAVLGHLRRPLACR